jgi:hypothetical protein
MLLEKKEDMGKAVVGDKPTIEALMVLADYKEGSTLEKGRSRRDLQGEVPQVCFDVL